MVKFLEFEVIKDKKEGKPRLEKMKRSSQISKFMQKLNLEESLKETFGKFNIHFFALLIHNHNNRSNFNIKLI